MDKTKIHIIRVFKSEFKIFDEITKKYFKCNSNFSKKDYFCIEVNIYRYINGIYGSYCVCTRNPTELEYPTDYVDDVELLSCLKYCSNIEYLKGLYKPNKTKSDLLNKCKRLYGG